MREAKIILPVLGNNGLPMDKEHASLEAMLVKQWGGCTRTLGLGLWNTDMDKLYREEVYIYTIAMEVTPKNRGSLQAIADAIGIAARQDAMYVCHADGEVVIS